MTTGAGRGDQDPAGGAIPTRVHVGGRSWLVPGLVVVLALAVVVLGLFGDKTSPRPPSPSQSPTATPASISLDWAEIPLDPATFDGAVVGLVVSGPRGVLVLGQERTDRHPIAWTSTDGRTWARKDLPPPTFGGGVPDAAVQLPSGWVAVGYHATADGTSRDIWTSSDGVAWTRDPSATGRGFDQVDALAGSGRSAVLVAEVAGRQLLLSSRDGQVWAETPDLDATLGRNPAIRDAVASASGFVAVGSVGSEPAIWRSPDGRDWARSAPLDPSLAPEARLQRVFRTAEGLLISGSGDFRGFSGGPSSWLSDDSVVWTPSPMSDQSLGELRTVLPLAGGNIGVTGDGSDENQGYPVAWAGTTLSTALTVPTPQPIDWSRQAAVVDGRVLLIADKPGDASIGAWLGTLDVTGVAAASTKPSEPATSGAVEAAPSAMPPLGRSGGSDNVLDWTVLKSSTIMNEEGRDLAIAGIVRLEHELLAYGSDGYDARFWLATDKSHWRLLPRSPAMHGVQVSGVASIHGRIVAVGQAVGADGGGRPAVWTSADGESWKRVNETRDGAPGELTDVVAGPAGLVAVGWREDGGTTHAIVWTSSDGSTWTTVTPIESDGSTSQFNAVARGVDGYVAVGSAQDSQSQTVGAAWTSPDGKTWTRVEAGTAFDPLPDPQFGDGSVTMLDVVAGDAVAGGPAFVAVGSTGSRFASAGVIFSSTDGRRWSRAPADPALDGVEFTSIVGWAGGLAAAGNVYSAGGPHPTIWMSRDGVAWAALDDADLIHGRSGDLRDAFMTDLVAEGSGLVAVGGAFTASEPLGALVYAGAGPGEIESDHVCPAVIDGPTRLASMTGADRAACIGARPVTVKAFVRAELNDCVATNEPPELSECGGSLWLAPIEGGPELLRISIDISLVDTFGTAASTPWKLTLRTDVIGEACDPVPARNGVVYEPPEGVDLRCRALLRLLAQEPIKAR